MLFPHMLNIVPPAWVHLLGEGDCPREILSTELAASHWINTPSGRPVKMHDGICEFSTEEYGVERVLIVRCPDHGFTFFLGVDQSAWPEPFWYWIGCKDVNAVAPQRFN